jgi:hypothetical protein
LSVVDSGAPPQKWGVFAVQDVAAWCPRRVVAIKVIRRGARGVQPPAPSLGEIKPVIIVDNLDTGGGWWGEGPTRAHGRANRPFSPSRTAKSPIRLPEDPP